MATRTVDLGDLARRFRILGDRYLPTVMIGARAAGERARAYLVQESMRKKIVDRGGYVRSWKSLVTANTLEVFNQAPYSGVIEVGRRPNSKPPPYRVLIPWVQRHITASHTLKSGPRKGQTIARKVRGDAAIGIAIAIAKSIGKKGQKGKFVLRDAEDKIVEFIKAEVEDALSRTLGQI